MPNLPATTRHGAAVARLSVPAGLAFVAAMFPQTATAVGMATPFAMALNERLIGRPTRMLEAALRRGEVVDLSGEQAESFVPMAYRFFVSARQGEYERNLKLLAAFLTEELKADACQPGTFLDMARRLEGLTITSLRAVALIGEWKRQCEAQGRTEPRNSITAAQLSNFKQFRSHLNQHEAIDALSDLQGRGFLYPGSSAFFGGTEQHFSTTQPLLLLISRALDVAAEATG